MNDFEKEFRKAKKYRFSPFIPLLIFWAFGYIKYNQGNKIVGAILIIVAFIVHIYLSSKYKCPNCKYSIDPRTPSSNLNYCPKCGVKLQNPKYDSY
jgi:DNA-directed RNA polymerase subunit RPC12/RpoP